MAVSVLILFSLELELADESGRCNTQCRQEAFCCLVWRTRSNLFYDGIILVLYLILYVFDQVVAVQRLVQMLLTA